MEELIGLGNTTIFLRKEELLFEVESVELHQKSSIWREAIRFFIGLA